MAVLDFSLLFVLILASHTSTQVYILSQNSVNYYCLENWQRYNDTCLLYVDQPKSFSRARQDCRERNGDLITIGSKEKNDFVAGKLFVKNAWIGLHRNAGLASPFIWFIEHKQMFDGGFRPRERDRCVFLGANGQWTSTYRCYEKRKYVCQTDACKSPQCLEQQPANDRRKRAGPGHGHPPIRVLPSVKDEERANPNYDGWMYRAEGPLLYLNPVTCSLFIILLSIFLALYVIFIKSLKKSVDQIKDDLNQRHDRSRFIDGSVYCSLPFPPPTTSLQ